MLFDEENEKDAEVTKPTSWGKPPTRMTSINVLASLWEEARQNNIGLKDALEFGIGFMIADKDGIDYPTCALQEKLHKTVAHRNALMKEVDALREQLPTVEEVEDEDIDDIIGAEVVKDE